MRPKPRNVTFACMISTDGTRTVTGIYRGRCYGKVGRQRIKMLSEIARETAVRTNHLDEVKRLSQKYATAEYPAMEWSF